MTIDKNIRKETVEDKKGFGVTGYEIKHSDFYSQAEIKLDISTIGLKPSEVSEYFEILMKIIHDFEKVDEQ